MKTLLKKIHLLSMLAVSCFYENRLNAQDMIPAVNADIFVTSTGTPFAHLNNAVYDGTALLYGTAWMENSDSYFIIEDPVGGTTTGAVTISHPTPGAISFPDIVIGAVDNASGIYYAGVVYHYNRPIMFAPTNRIYMDVYQLKFVGGAIQIIGSNLAIPIAPSIAMASSEPRIDLINKEDPGNTGVVFSDRFVLTWQQWNGSAMQIYATSGLLSDLYANGSGATFTNSGVVVTGAPQVNLPDICGIERFTTSAVEDIAYIVWGSGGAGIPYVKQWNVTQNTLGAATMVDIVGAIRPRIDGIDPYTQAGNGEDYYITYGYGGTQQIRSYTPTFGVFSNTQTAFNGNFPYFDMISNSNCRTPVVSCGPGANYNIAFFSQGASSVLLEQMDWNNGFNNNCACTTTSINPTQDYFQVSMSGGSMYVANSCAWKYDNTSGITVPSNGLVSWYNSGIYQKPYDNTTLGTGPFKPAPSSVSNTTQKELPLTLAPNPANETLNVSGLSKDADYTVTDITGRTVINGNMKAASAHIHTNSLAPGMYLLNVDGNKLKFVKE